MTQATSPHAVPLASQVALVTGASSGLGRATVLALARAGADIGLLARNENDLQRVAAEIAAIGRRALPLPVDLADAEQIAVAVGRTVETFGRVDILVNAAGTDVPGQVVDLPIDGWDRVLDVNLRAPFVLAKAVFPHMQHAGRGTIVNISSVAGKRGWANAAAYCASKFGLTGFTQALAAEGKPHGIRACILYPGGMATSWGAWSPAERDAQDRASLPATKALPPDEVAALIVWIASAPPELVLNEAIVTPLEEGGWP
jgi:NAD(P)-dependent dehydrogenase (short-subunit alcohol dehydrogenase family)